MCGLYIQLYINKLQVDNFIQSSYKYNALVMTYKPQQQSRKLCSLDPRIAGLRREQLPGRVGCRHERVRGSGERHLPVVR